MYINTIMIVSLMLYCIKLAVALRSTEAIVIPAQ